MMPDERGTLPGNERTPVDATDDRTTHPGTIPTREVPLPASDEASSTSDLDGAASEKPHRGPAKASDGVTTPPPISKTIEERIVAATRDGGLSTLPADFGVDDGGWTTVNARDPFTQLYLDFRQAGSITPELVAHHHELLQTFWRDRIRAMRQGAARVTILKKYGGEHESERLILRYPEVLASAYERLATRSGIATVASELIAERQAEFFARFDAKLNDFLIDALLQPAETRALFEMADADGISRSVAATRIRAALDTQHLTALTPPSNGSLEAQLLSTSWGIPAVPAVTTGGPPYKPRSYLWPLLVFTFAVVLALLIAAAVLTTRFRSQQATSGDTASQKAASDVLPRVETVVVHDTVAAPPNPATPATSRSEPPRSPVPARAETVASIVPPVLQPAISAEERQRTRDTLEEIQRLLATDPVAALQRASDLEAKLELHPRDYADERVALANLRAQLQTAITRKDLDAERERLQREAALNAEQQRDAAWEKRLTAIEELSRKGNYSGAKTLADQLLAEANVPEAVAARAKRLSDDAVVALQHIWSDTKVTSKTGRSKSQR